MTAAGAGIGLINGVGNLGSFFGPYLGGWLSDLSGGGYALTQALLLTLGDASPCRDP